jgi:hypothetical protein
LLTPLISTLVTWLVPSDNCANCYLASAQSLATLHGNFVQGISDPNAILGASEAETQSVQVVKASFGNLILHDFKDHIFQDKGI